MEKKRPIIINLIYNILATAFPIAILQLLLLPLMSKNMSDISYGLLVTIISVLNICPGVLGIAINNVRLLESRSNNCYNTFCFQHIYLELNVINIIIVLIFCIYYENEINYSCFLTLFLSVMWLAREYYIVQFQVELLYNKILINNIIMSIGYLIGYCIFYFSGLWQMTYIIGYFLGLLHIALYSNYWKERVVSLPQIGYFRKQVYFLAISAILVRIATYADRLLLYPIMGGKQVSVYYSATIISKLVAMAINPISSVLLSYLSKMDKMNKKFFNNIFIIIFLLCLIGYFITVTISGFALKLLYPKYMNEAFELVPYTALAAALYVMISFLNPFILKFFDLKWQFIINGFNAFFYVIISFIGLKIAGLIGFCIGIVFTNTLKLISMFILYYKGRIRNVL